MENVFLLYKGYARMGTERSRVQHFVKVLGLPLLTHTTYDGILWGQLRVHVAHAATCVRRPRACRLRTLGLDSEEQENVAQKIPDTWGFFAPLKLQLSAGDITMT